MLPHLTDDEVGRIRQRIAPADELVRAGEHTAACAECRTRLHADSDVVEAILGDADEWHPDAELLIAKVDGTLDAIDRDIVEPHLADCMQCRREVRDLENFRRTLKPRPRWQLFAAAAAIIIIAVLLYPIYNRSVAPTAAITLIDGGRQVSVMHDGRVAGLALNAGMEARLAAALQHGALGEPARIAALRHETESLRGASASGAFSPIVPIGCVVVTQQPTFEWTAVPGARYKVELFGDQFRPVAQSELLETNRWTVPQPLAHGEIYAWQVTAYKPNGESTMSPAPPAPEARFAVIDVNDATRIDQLQQMRPQSHLALGVAYAEAGAAFEAERELEALTAENRGAEPAARLLRAIRTRH
ncbi:MAG: hypothetical protein QOI24_533 [Acidobacteriota bacterium]|jgi:hypothetical protein|nr:hypothetical protein [Acidobacteriota bacterium]